MYKKLDELDRTLVANLVEDSSLSSKELARRLAVHPNTLLQRIKRLERNGIIKKYTAVVDYSKLGYSLQGVILLSANMNSKWEEKLKPVVDMPEVVSFVLLTGDFDALIQVRVSSHDELVKVLRKIVETGVVRRTSSYIVLDHYKWPSEYNPLKKQEE